MGSNSYHLLIHAAQLNSQPVRRALPWVFIPLPIFSLGLVLLSQRIDCLRLALSSLGGKQRLKTGGPWGHHSALNCLAGPVDGKGMRERLPPRAYREEVVGRKPAEFRISKMDRFINADGPGLKCMFMAMVRYKKVLSRYSLTVQQLPLSVLEAHFSSTERESWIFDPRRKMQASTTSAELIEAHCHHASIEPYILR